MTMTTHSIMLIRSQEVNPGSKESPETGSLLSLKKKYIRTRMDIALVVLERL
jgi:hypothetical protein